MIRRTLGCLTLLAVAFSSAQAQTFPKRKMEDLVQQILERRTGIRDVKVECPVATPIGVGQRAVCTATGRDGSSFSVALIQTDETGGVTFTVTDMAALDALQPATLDFFERWKADDVEGIWDGGHARLHEISRIENFTQLLRCTAADFGGLDSIGEAEGAAMHREDGSGQLITLVRFGAGEGEVTLNFGLSDDTWKLTGVVMPIPQLDPSSIASDPLVRHAAALFERVDADDWAEALDMLSYELRGEAADEEIRAALDDPWNLGSVRRVEMTAYGHNVNDLPFVVTKLVRERGEQRVWLIFRSCGDEWKVRTMQLLAPEAELPLVRVSEVQAGIVQALGEQGVDVSLECPGTEIAIMPGIVYTCQAAHESGITAAVEITIDEDGESSWQLLGGSEWDPFFQ